MADELVITPVELAFLAARGSAPCRALVEQLGVPHALVADEGFQASGAQVLVTRGLAVYDGETLAVEPSVAQIAAVLESAMTTVVLLAQVGNQAVSGARVIDGSRGRLLLTPTTAKCWSIRPLDPSEGLVDVVHDAVQELRLRGAVADILIALAPNADLALERTAVIHEADDSGEASGVIRALFGADDC